MSDDKNDNESVSVLSLNLAVTQVMVPFLTHDWSKMGKSCAKFKRQSEGGLEQIVEYLGNLGDERLNEEQTMSFIEVVEDVIHCCKDSGTRTRKHFANKWQ